jgi:Tfp pilus assembly protein PilP
MRIGKWILAIWIAAGAWALAANPQPPAPAAKPGADATAEKSSSPAGANDVKKGDDDTQSEAASKARKRSRKHERDPFVSPLAKRKAGGPVCTGTGRQCLFAGQIVLQGVVKYSGGYVAVVGSGKNTYFLRDEDPLADGKVERISQDSIVLLQRSTDVFGRPVVRKITKKLKNPAV